MIPFFKQGQTKNKTYERCQNEATLNSQRDECRARQGQALKNE